MTEQKIENYKQELNNNLKDGEQDEPARQNRMERLKTLAQNVGD